MPGDLSIRLEAKKHTSKNHGQSSAALEQYFEQTQADERVKLPISARWQEGTHYQIAVQDGRVIVEASSPSVMGGEQAVA